MENIEQEEKDWRKYEKLIAKSLEKNFPGCSITFNDSIFGLFSEVDRQVDVSIRGTVAGQKILGIVDCKYYKDNIDVKGVESFLGMLEDLNANIGIMITNQGYSDAAKKRTKVKNLNLEVVKIQQLDALEVDLDDLINKKIQSLRLSKFEYFQRLRENWREFDEGKSSYSKRLVTFKPGFANTEYFAYNKTIKVAAKIFRDFPELPKVKIRIPAVKQDDSTNWQEEKWIYECEISRSELEAVLNIDFWGLRHDIKRWRAEFLENNSFTKNQILEFGEKYIKSKKVRG